MYTTKRLINTNSHLGRKKRKNIHKAKLRLRIVLLTTTLESKITEHKLAPTGPSWTQFISRNHSVITFASIVKNGSNNINNNNSDDWSRRRFPPAIITKSTFIRFHFLASSSRLRLDDNIRRFGQYLDCYSRTTPKDQQVIYNFKLPSSKCVIKIDFPCCVLRYAETFSGTGWWLIYRYRICCCV